ncbi:hypothetical protein DL768_006788 [Monosporascus sp. mg162]|nr:hypothetical protein DL768_006788 [Monosporascus sp. mg162]
MASEKLFRDAPPFPDNVPTAPMYTISLAALHSGDRNPAERVLAACQELGPFLLDLRKDRLGKMVEEIDQLFQVAPPLQLDSPTARHFSQPWRRLPKPSGTVVRPIKALSSPQAEDFRSSMLHHADFGTITLLANVLEGPQIPTPGKPATDETARRWVRPQPGCLTVNLEDEIIQWTGGILRSNVHRINYAPGQQRYVDPDSLAILVRPERNAAIQDISFENLKVKDLTSENDDIMGQGLNPCDLPRHFGHPELSEWFRLETPK